MRSRLGVSWEEADGLPWWQHAAYLEGLEWDLARESGQELEEHTTSDLDSLGELGMTVREVG